MEKLSKVELEVLSTITEQFENVTMRETGMINLSGGFAHAELVDYNSDEVNIMLKWGIQTDCENKVYIESYVLDRSSLTTTSNIMEVIRSLR